MFGVYWGVILYIIIGIIISGFVNATNFAFSDDAIVMVAIFWPMLLVAFGLYYCVIGPYRLGE